MPRSTQQQHTKVEVEVPLSGRKRASDAPNALQFLVYIEGVEDYDGHIRGANGVRWRVA